jgi:hypothetical protein
VLRGRRFRAERGSATDGIFGAGVLEFAHRADDPVEFLVGADGG